MITMTMNTKQVTNYLGNVAKQIPYASMVALNNIAFGVQKAEVVALDKYIDRPTPFTKRSYEVVKASKTRLIASVRARQIQAEYLKWQVYGGSKPAPGKAISLPVSLGTNQYGNFRRGEVKRLVDRKDAFSKRIKGVAGIWQRRKEGRASRLFLMVAYEPKATYSKRLPFHEVAETEVMRSYQGEFTKGLGRALGSAK